MARTRLACVSIVALLLFALAAAVGSSGTVAQDSGPDATIEALQTRVAELEGTSAARGEKINAQRTTIAELRDPVATATPELPEITTISGVGTTVTDGFSLERGRYRVTATVESWGYSFFILHMYGESGDLGSDGYVLNEFTEEGNGVWEISAVFTTPRDGTYFAEVSNTQAPWTLTFEKMG